jgi:hypothetical protein
LCKKIPKKYILLSNKLSLNTWKTQTIIKIDW